MSPISQTDFVQVSGDFRADSWLLNFLEGSGGRSAGSSRG